MPSAWRPNSPRWCIAKPFDDTDQLAQKLGTAPLIVQMLANRGITDLEGARSFLNPKLSDLHDPAELPGAREAGQRIARAVADKERIVIYGDYDVDGITAVAILHACLRLVDANVGFYVPHRLEEGYGVNRDAVRKLLDEGTQLLITVDCGISAVGPLTEAMGRGMDVIITDHHSPPAPEARPDATAIVHPQIGDYPNPYLSGAGVAFKVAWETARNICGTERVDAPMRDFLLDATSLAALGTVADVVPLTGENRALVTYGLRGLPATKHPGLRALLESARLADEKLDAYHVGFVLAPRINACGRMGHARLAVELLTDAPPERCKKIAEYLGTQNNKRRQIERAITQEAIEMVTSRGLDSPENRAIVLWSEKWHGGVIGIVASRLVRRFGRPAIMVAINGEGGGQGSGRSIEGFHMRDALAECSEHLLNFGGHAMAGGLRVESAKLPAFAAAFAHHAEQCITEEQLSPTLRIDAETTLGALNFKVAEHIGRLQPFGEGNPRPLIVVRGCEVLTPPKRMGRNGATVGMMLSQGGARMRAVGFGMGDLADQMIGINTIDVAAEPVLNTFNGRTTVELKLTDVKWE